MNSIDHNNVNVQNHMQCLQLPLFQRFIRSEAVSESKGTFTAIFFHIKFLPADEFNK